MEEAKILVPVSEYSDSIRREERLEIVREYVQNNQFVSREVIAKIMGFEIPREENNENG